MTSGKVWCARIRIVIAVLGITAGVSAFFAFTFGYANVQAGLWALVSGVFATAVLILHVLKQKDRMDMCCSSGLLKLFMCVGFIAQTIGLVGLITYLVLAIQSQEGFDDYSTNKYIRAVWAFMTWKWSFQLMLYSWTYRKQLYTDTYTELGS